MSGVHQATAAPPHQLDSGEKNIMKRLLGQDKDGGIKYSAHCHRHNRLNLGKLVLFVANQIRVG